MLLMACRLIRRRKRPGHDVDLRTLPLGIFLPAVLAATRGALLIAGIVNARSS